MERRYDALLFDLFGTRIDDLRGKVYSEAHQQIAEILPVSVDIYRRPWAETMPVRDTRAMAVSKWTLPMPQDYLDRVDTNAATERSKIR